MAFSLNRVTLIGNAGKDPEIRSTQDGREVATFTLATTESWKDKNTGERKERTEWHRIVIFSQHLIGVVKKYIHKGSKVYVEGPIHTRKWNDQSGAERQTTEIVIQSYSGSILLLDNKGASTHPAADGGGGAGHHDNPSSQDKTKDFEVEHLDDDVPF